MSSKPTDDNSIIAQMNVKHLTAEHKKFAIKIGQIKARLAKLTDQEIKRISEDGKVKKVSINSDD